VAVINLHSQISALYKTKFNLRTNFDHKSMLFGL